MPSKDSSLGSLASRGLYRYQALSALPKDLILASLRELPSDVANKFSPEKQPTTYTGVEENLPVSEMSLIVGGCMLLVLNNLVNNFPGSLNEKKDDMSTCLDRM